MKPEMNESTQSSGGLYVHPLKFRALVSSNSNPSGSAVHGAQRARAPRAPRRRGRAEQLVRARRRRCGCPSGGEAIVDQVAPNMLTACGGCARCSWLGRLDETWHGGSRHGRDEPIGSSTQTLFRLRCIFFFILSCCGGLPAGAEMRSLPIVRNNLVVITLECNPLHA